MSDETPRGRTGHGASLVAWNRHAKPGIAPRRSDTGGRGGNMADVHRDRLPLARRVLADFFSPNGASRRPWRSRRPGIADTGMSVMRAVLAGLALAALLPFGPAPVIADTGVRLDGPRIQGGLLRGQVPPGSAVEFRGDAVRVSKDGWFLVGLGREAPPEAELVVVFPDGRRERQVLKVDRREYDIQRIDGLPPGKVTPRSEEDLARIMAEIRMTKQARAIDDSRTDFLSGFRWPIKGPDQRCLRFAAHPQRRAPAAALRDRHRGADRHQGRRAGRRRGHHGASGHVLLRRHHDRRPRPRAVVGVPASVAHPGREGPACGTGRDHRGGRVDRPLHGASSRLADQPLRPAPRPGAARRADAEVGPRARPGWLPRPDSRFSESSPGGEVTREARRNARGSLRQYDHGLPRLDTQDAVPEGIHPELEDPAPCRPEPRRYPCSSISTSSR